MKKYKIAVIVSERKQNCFYFNENKNNTLKEKKNKFRFGLLQLIKVHFLTFMSS